MGDEFELEGRRVTEGDASYPPEPGADLLDDEPLLLPLGTVLADCYELRERLGTGGMAQVFGAFDLCLGRQVAVKVARAQAYESLRAEGRALALLRSPHIVAALHAGVHRSLAYLVLERLHGSSLRSMLDRHLEQGTLPAIPFTTGTLAQLASTLAFVHEAGLSHRDLKPDNVMLAPGDRLVLMDFGLARPEFSPEETIVSGSPSYMAPEIIGRRIKPGQGHRADLYSLGALAYELLVGQPPFFHDDWNETLLAHQLEAPADPRVYRDDVPAHVAELVMRLLAKDPDERPESAEVVAWALAASARRQERHPELVH
jgi:serine/threonine-protein kinase